ncbi:MAG TPA: bifunctional precorrin-2 dehydrogenase/sirohydrochlorin ferrochelatase [Dehalococcoidia bacterium]|nr:bifunctional precorrin-2 dehydrogenase/sirohydrochlorin ferrochelatase [Dehalococcoidia bacterium]
MGYYPVFLELAARRVLVVGGGNVALQKVRGLLAADAAVTLVAPDLHAELRVLLDDGAFTYIGRDYHAGDLAGFDLVMVATDDGVVNGAVAAEARAARIWVNSADDVPNCDFILPSVIRKGQIVVAASTGGASPALARRLREELGAYLTDDFEPLAELLAEVRGELRQQHVHVDADTWQRAIDGQLRVLLAQRRYGQAKAYLLRGLGLLAEPIGAPRTGDVPLPATAGG